MEKYNAETMAIVPRELTDLMALALLDQFESTGSKTITANYGNAIYLSPKVDKVVPLREVLELLEAIGEGDIAVSIAVLKLKQKYGVSK